MVNNVEKKCEDCKYNTGNNVKDKEDSYTISFKVLIVIMLLALAVRLCTDVLAFNIPV